MKAARCSLLVLAISLPLIGCHDWIEEQRQANFEQCKLACS